MNYFVTGTDTGVGKTLISCALLRAFAAQGKSVVGMKPLAAGCDEDGVNADVKQLRAASNVPATFGQINPYSFLQPIAPHIAARNAGVRIELARILMGMRLGCLNHALLTVRAITDYQLECAGWVANVLDADMLALPENIEALRQRIAAPLLGVVPYMAEPDAQMAASVLDLGLLGGGCADVPVGTF